MITLVYTSIIFQPEVFGAQIERRVSFKKGKTPVLVKGKLPLDAYYDSYYFAAKARQTLTVKLVTDDPEGYIAIYETKELGPDEDTILANSERSRVWTGRLPVTGEYSVQVYDASENGLNRFAYSIEITLK